MLVAGVCWGQDVYKYDNLTVTAKSYGGEVKWNGYNFELKDSCVDIEVEMFRRYVSMVTIRNLTSQPMIARWKQFSASNMTYLLDLIRQDPKKYRKYNYRYYNVEVDPTSFVSDKQSGEETIYVNGTRHYSFQWCEYDMFPEKLEKTEGEIYLPLVINGREVMYSITLTGINSVK